MSGHAPTTGRNGKLVDFGTLIQPGSPFDASYPDVADLLRDVHGRRNQLPGSHPYDKKGGARNRFLKKADQRSFVTKLSRIYEQIQELFNDF
jgi:hypothetical protein